MILPTTKRPYTIPFSGPVSGLHAGEVAAAFIKSVSVEREAAVVFDHNGSSTTVAAWLDIVRSIAPEARVDISGDALPFPADLSDDPIRNFLGDFGKMPLEDGIKETFDAFQSLLGQGKLSADALG